jgi:histone-lysine N-methyltransferase SETMAR
LARDLQWALRKKRPDLAVENIILHQDNASPHTAAVTQLEIDVLGFQRLSHPPYSPDLAPFDFALFPEIKAKLKGHRFESLKQLHSFTLSVIRSFGKDWYQNIIKRQWIKRHERCLLHAGAYFEKK